MNRYTIDVTGRVLDGAVAVAERAGDGGRKLVQHANAGAVLGEIEERLMLIEGLCFEAQSDIPDGYRARVDVQSAATNARELLVIVRAAKVVACAGNDAALPEQRPGTSGRSK